MKQAFRPEFYLCLDNYKLNSGTHMHVREKKYQQLDYCCTNCMKQFLELKLIKCYT